MHNPKLIAPFLSAAMIVTAGTAFAAPAVLRAPMTQSVPATATFPYPGPFHQVYGVIRAIKGNTLTLQTRRGMLAVDASWAIAAQRVTPLFVPRPVIVRGAFVRNTLVANEVAHNNHPALAEWGPDR